jgi:hypothetical protein
MVHICTFKGFPRMQTRESSGFWLLGGLIIGSQVEVSGYVLSTFKIRASIAWDFGRIPTVFNFPDHLKKVSLFHGLFIQSARGSTEYRYAPFNVFDRLLIAFQYIKAITLVCNAVGPIAKGGRQPGP